MQQNLKDSVRSILNEYSFIEFVGQKSNTDNTETEFIAFYDEQFERATQVFLILKSRFIVLPYCHIEFVNEYLTEFCFCLIFPNNEKLRARFYSKRFIKSII